MKILFTGGGTGGSITPLIAIYQQFNSEEKQRQFEFFWIGGKEGIEREMIQKYDIKYYSVSSGKFRRYFSFQNFIDPFRIIKAFFQSIRILRKIRPDIIIAAGSYISAPVVWAGAFLKISILVHQQDVTVGLANRLMSRYAKRITVSLKDSLKDFPKEKVIYTGNPVRKEVLESQDKNYIKNKYKLDDLPTILFIGGGTGAEEINKAVAKHLEKILQIANIFHIAGKNKKIDIANNIKNIHRYYQFDFIGEELYAIMNSADLVISRAGMSVLSELAILGKPAIIVPIPNSHQEKNAAVFYKNNSAIVYEQKYLEDDSFSDLIAELLTNKSKLNTLSLNIKKMMPNDAAKRVAEVITHNLKPETLVS